MLSKKKQRFAMMNFMTTHFKLAILSLFIILSTSSVMAQGKQEEDSPKKKVETKITEVITTDSLPASELMKRAVNWVKLESKTYVKSKGATTSNKAECTAIFLVKPKELNPQVDYTGKITMNVSIECKDSKYRYTVAEIKHTSKSGKANGGNIDNAVPDCGSMGMDDIIWKKLKGEAMRYATQVVTDLKAGMAIDSSVTATEEW